MVRYEVESFLLFFVWSFGERTKEHIERIKDSLFDINTCMWAA